jgi:hypothetical protein
MFDGGDALQTGRIKKLLGPDWMFQDFLGQESAAGKYGHQMAQADGGAHESGECAWVLLAQTRKVVQSLLGRGRARQQ